MNIILLCILLMITGCATAEPDRPHSPALILTMEENLDWLHGQRFNFKQLKNRALVSIPVQKYSSNGELNKDTIALGVGRNLWLFEKQSLGSTLSDESNKGALVLDQNSEFVIVASYTIKRKNWWDRLGTDTIRMLIVEDSNKEKSVMLDSFLVSSSKPELFDFARMPI